MLIERERHLNDNSPHFDVRTGLLKGGVHVNKEGNVNVVLILTQGKSLGQIIKIKRNYFILNDKQQFWMLPIDDGGRNLNHIAENSVSFLGEIMILCTG